jgi:dihydropteroate synthase
MNFLERPKDSIFSKKQLLNCRGKLLNISSPLLMGILNLTPDSFYDGGKLATEKALLKQAERMILDGADILDVGGHSTRPGATAIDEIEELERVLSSVKRLHQHFPSVPISIDTYRGKVAEAAIAEGASIVNDVSAGNMDENMVRIVAQLNVPYVVMHMQGQPNSMQKKPHYENVGREVRHFLSEKINRLRSLGIKDLIVDPGFGFGKTVTHNFELLQQLDQFKLFELPVMVGISRKSMINAVLHSKVENALNGSTVIHTIALLNGASILRVHDVREAKEAVKIVMQYQNN